MNKAELMSNAETEVMKILWQHNGQPVTSTEIRQELENNQGWTKSTILTLIRRLVEKGVVSCEKKEVFYYTPLISEKEYQSFQTRRFIDRIYGGNVKNLLTALCRTENITRSDIEELQAYLDREAGKNG